MQVSCTLSCLYHVNPVCESIYVLILFRCHLLLYIVIADPMSPSWVRYSGNQPCSALYQDLTKIKTGNPEDDLALNEMSWRALSTGSAGWLLACISHLESLIMPERTAVVMGGPSLALWLESGRCFWSQTPDCTCLLYLALHTKNSQNWRVVLNWDETELKNILLTANTHLVHGTRLGLIWHTTSCFTFTYRVWMSVPQYQLFFLADLLLLCYPRCSLGFSL